MFLELSHVVTEKDPVYPDNPPTRLEKVEEIGRGGVTNLTMIHHFSHNGTHVDAPYHFCEDGWKIEDIPLDRFVFERPFLVNRPKKPGENFSLLDLEGMNELERADLIMFRSGFDRLRREDPITYRFLFPGIDEELARFLREELPNLKAIMLDFLSADSLLEGARKNFPAHRWLLCRHLSDKRPVLIFEDVNLEPLVGRKVELVIALPIRFRGAEAAPVSVVAKVL